MINYKSYKYRIINQRVNLIKKKDNGLDRENAWRPIPFQGRIFFIALPNSLHFKDRRPGRLDYPGYPAAMPLSAKR